MLPSSHKVRSHPRYALCSTEAVQEASGWSLRTHLWWGQAFTQVMHKVQSLLSVSWAGWLCRGQPAVASPSGGSAGPPLRQWYVLQLPADDSKPHADTWQ